MIKIHDVSVSNTQMISKNIICRRDKITTCVLGRLNYLFPVTATRGMSFNFSTVILSEISEIL